MKNTKKKATSGVRVEPHEDFKTAIIGVNKRGEYVYSYRKLVGVCIDTMKMDIEDAEDYVDYNIAGLAPNGFEVRG